MYPSAGQPYPYHNTSAVHAFRRSSLSPPDADVDSSHIPPVADLDGSQAASPYLGARFQTRRTSSLSYQNSGAQDPHDRNAPRNPKNIVVVIPPPDFPLDQLQLGHVLSMGPRHRLSQGLIMPLFSSMFGQLNAIAREYNFPSISGLCLFLHMNENGIAMTPRISDDSWQYLFGHLFEARQSFGGQQLPIGGCIEFDIDLNKARWFDAWVSGALRDSEPAIPPVVPSHASLAVHRRKESESSNLDGQLVEDRWEGSTTHTLHTNSRPETVRHVPRKLSLVDRLETRSIHIPPKSQNHLGLSGFPPKWETHGLSPIPQSATPLPAKSGLEDRVTSWRAATELDPISMAEAYKPTHDIGASVDVATMDEYALGHDVRQEDNGDKYDWSISSVGPCSPVVDSPVASSRPSSVHLDRRANGSVPATPTTATSWGPADDDWYSIISSTSRLPSPDIGERAVEDVMAPRRGGVWGNSFGWRSAMTWKEVYPYSTLYTKPPMRVQLQDTSARVAQYPNLVIYPTVDYHLDIENQPDISKPESSPRPVWGNSFGWQKGITWRKAYPYSTVQSVASVQLRGAGGLVPNYPNLCIYPVVYPRCEIYPACTVDEDISQPVSVILDRSRDLMMGYPSLMIYSSVYPHLDIYPPVVDGANMKASTEVVDTSIYSPDRSSTSYPNLVIYPAVYPYFDFYPKALQITETAKQEVVVKLINAGCLTAEYPNITIYPSAYPYLEIYPRCDTVCITDEGRSSLYYPYLIIFPATYPHFDIYPLPAAIAEVEEYCIPTTLMAHYPNLVIYPAVYPHFDLYLAMARISNAVEWGKGPSSLRNRRIEMWRAKTATQLGLVGLLSSNHIWEVKEPLQLDLTEYAWSPTSAGPATSPLESPHTVSILASVHMDRRVQGSVALTPSTATTWGWQDDDWYWEIVSVDCLPSPDLGQRAVDDIENPRFPHRPWLTASVSEYPYLVIYPPAYPLYPTRQAFTSTSNGQVIEILTSSNIYPVLDIYPSIYPHFNIYPAYLQIEAHSKVISNVRHERVEVKLPSLYPNLDIYHACYPYNLDYIYPSTNAAESDQIPVEASSGYPWLVIYPPVYPHIIPYPGSSAEIVQPMKPESTPMLPLVETKQLGVKLPVLYPTLELYSAGYPWLLECIYPVTSIDAYSGVPKLKSYYPHIQIYASAYPFVQPYPTDSVDIPGALDEGEYWSAKAFLALSELRRTNAKYAYFPALPILVSQQGVQDAHGGDSVTPTPRILRSERKTHMELHATVLRFLEKRPVQHSKTHFELHAEVFQDGIVRSPSGYTQDPDLSSLTTKKPGSTPELQPRPLQAQGNHTPRPSSSRSGTTAVQSPENIVFPLGQAPLSPISPSRLRSPGVPSQPPPAVSESPVPRISSPPSVYMHKRSPSSRLAQAVQSMMAGAQRRSSSGTPGSPPPEDHRERVNSTRFLSLTDRRPLPQNTSEFTARASHSLQRKDSLVLQRARAYEQSTGAPLR